MRHRKCKECDYGYPAESHTDPSQEQDAVDDWNEKYPIGTPVLFQSVKGIGEPVQTKTRSIAWLVSNNPCVMVEGKAGGCSLSHMKVKGV